MVRYIPNLLSFFRVVDLIIIIGFLEKGLNIWAFLFFLLGALSDFLDGHIARKNRVVSRVGKILDPLADKILVIGLLIALVKIVNVPYWMVIVIVFREFAVTGLRVVAASENVVISANIWGKLKTVSQFVALSLLILNFREYGVYALFVAVIITLISGFIYYYEYFKDRGTNAFT